MFLNSINHFRAIAIVIIVAGHSYKLAGLTFDSVWEITLRNLITGGTSLFVFISGFLFHHVFYKKYNYKSFIKGKGRNVFIPYLILGIVPVAFYVILKNEGWDGHFLPTGKGFFNEYILPTMHYYWTGRFLTAYWYIPFIMITFMMAPLHISFIKADLKIKLSIILFLSLVSVLIHRSPFGLNVIQSVVYYTPVYLIGIACSIYKDKIYSYTSGREYYLLFGAVSLAIIQALTSTSGAYQKAPFDYAGIDLMFFQKIMLSIFFLVWLHKFEKYTNKYMQVLAATSFAIFFLHPFIIWILYKIVPRFIGEFTKSWLLYPFIIIFLILFCIGIAKVVRKVARQYSRYIIGY